MKMHHRHCPSIIINFIQSLRKTYFQVSSSNFKELYRRKHVKVINQFECSILENCIMFSKTFQNKITSCFPFITTLFCVCPLWDTTLWLFSQFSTSFSNSDFSKLLLSSSSSESIVTSIWSSSDRVIKIMERRRMRRKKPENPRKR